MGDRVHVGTLLWGLFLTAWGVVVLGIGLEWWSIDLDLRYAGPILIIIVGAVIVVSALASRGDSET